MKASLCRIYVVYFGVSWFGGDEFCGYFKGVCLQIKMKLRFINSLEAQRVAHSSGCWF